MGIPYLLYSKHAQLQVPAVDLSYTSIHELWGPPVSSICIPILALTDCDQVLLNLLFDMTTVLLSLRINYKACFLVLLLQLWLEGVEVLSSSGNIGS